MSDNKNSEFDMDPEYLMKQLNKQRGTGKPQTAKKPGNDVVLRAPAPKKTAPSYDPDDDEVSAEEYARIKARYTTGSETKRTQPARSGRSNTEMARLYRERERLGREEDGAERKGAARPAGTRPAGTRRPDGTRPAGTRPAGSRSADGTRPAGVRPAGSRSADGTRPAGTRPAGSRSADGTRPAGVRPAGSRSADGARPAGTRPAGTRRPDGTRPAGTRRPDGTRPGSRTRGNVPVRTKQESKGFIGFIKRVPLFWLCLAAWAVILLIVGICLVHYVKKCLVQYEASQPDNVIEGFIYDFKDMIVDGTIGQKIELPQGTGDFEDKNIFANMYTSQLKGTTSITYAKDKKSYDSKAPVYDIYCNDKLVAKMTLKSKNDKTLIKMLNVCDWEIGKISPVFEAVTTDYSITVPENYKVTVNGKEVTSAYIDGESVENNTLKTIAKYVQLPASVTYKIKGLVNKPEVKITDDKGADVSFTPDENGNINVAYSAESGEVSDEVKTRVLTDLKTWQSFLHAELSGAAYGLADVQKFLLKDSVYWEQAEVYSSSPDIQFVSDHDKSKNTYTEETVDNYIKYTENCYSVHVVLNKSMILTRTGETATDKIDSTIYYIYYDDSDDGTDNPHWVIADMVATKKK